MKLGELPGNFATFICGCVFRVERDVKLVVFYEDGDLAMLCGGMHNFNQDIGKLVGVGHLLSQYPTLKDLDIRPGFEAKETKTGEWRYAALDPEEQE